MGGRVGLKGTDGVSDKAVALGAEPVAPGKAAQMLLLLRRLLNSAPHPDEIEWLTCSGTMGEEALRAAGFENIEVVYQTPASPVANDTEAAVRAL